MKKYTVIEAIVIPSGEIQLDGEQARKRSHQVGLVKGDVYQIMKPVSFKVGEVVGFTTLPNAHYANLEEIANKPVRKKKK